MDGRGWRSVMEGRSSRRHVALLYREPPHFHASAAAWLAGALTDGGAAILVARPGSREGILAALRGLTVDVENHLAAGRFVVLEAAQSLEALQDGGGRVPVERFRAHFAPIVDRAIAACSGGASDVRVVGETVNLAAERGLLDAAPDLARGWADLSDARPIHLLWSLTPPELELIGAPLLAQGGLTPESRSALHAATRAWRASSEGAAATERPEDLAAYLHTLGAQPMGSPPQAWIIPFDRKAAAPPA